MEMQLQGAHQTTYDAIFQHPISRNLQWRDLRSLLAAISEATDEPNGNLKVTRNGHTLVIHAPSRKDFSDVQELMKIRHFLEQSAPASTQVVAAQAPGGAHVLVVIDHRLARVYNTELHGSVPKKIVPLDADRHLHYVQEDGNGQRRPEIKSFYTAVAKSLEHAEQIVIFGRGTGASSAMDQLLAELDQHHKDIRRRVIGSIVVNEQHMSDDQLLAKAREVYAKLGVKSA